jgi:hypothetical protein
MMPSLLESIVALKIGIDGKTIDIEASATNVLQTAVTHKAKVPDCEST